MNLINQYKQIKFGDTAALAVKSHSLREDQRYIWVSKNSYDSHLPTTIEALCVPFENKIYLCSNSINLSSFYTIAKMTILNMTFGINYSNCALLQKSDLIDGSILHINFKKTFCQKCNLMICRGNTLCYPCSISL